METLRQRQSLCKLPLGCRKVEARAGRTPCGGAYIDCAMTNCCAAAGAEAYRHRDLPGGHLELVIGISLSEAM